MRLSLNSPKCIPWLWWADGHSLVSTSVGVVVVSSGAKNDSGLTSTALELIVSKETGSCFGRGMDNAYSVESFLVATELQRGLMANQLRLPCVPT